MRKNNAPEVDAYLDTLCYMFANDIAHMPRGKIQITEKGFSRYDFHFGTEEVVPTEFVLNALTERIIKHGYGKMCEDSELDFNSQQMRSVESNLEKLGVIATVENYTGGMSDSDLESVVIQIRACALEQLHKNNIMPEKGFRKDLHDIRSEEVVVTPVRELCVQMWGARSDRYEDKYEEKIANKDLVLSIVEKTDTLFFRFANKLAVEIDGIILRSDAIDPSSPFIYKGERVIFTDRTDMKNSLSNSLLDTMTNHESYEPNSAIYFKGDYYPMFKGSVTLKEFNKLPKKNLDDINFPG